MGPRAIKRSKVSTHSVELERRFGILDADHGVAEKHRIAASAHHNLPCPTKALTHLNL